MSPSNKKQSKAKPAKPATSSVPTSEIAQQKEIAPATSASRDDAHSSADTSLSFFSFILAATTEDIEKFLAFAATTPEGMNLQHLWRRAYKEGYKNAKKVVLQDVEKRLEAKYEEGIERGMDLGREEGYTVAKGAFDSMIEKIKAREAPKTNTTNVDTQTDIPPTTTTFIFTKTNPTTFAAMSQARTLVETGVSTCLAPTIAVSESVQTTSCTFPLAVSTTQTEIRPSQHVDISSSTGAATSQSPVPFENSKNTKNCAVRPTISKKSQNITIRSSPTSSSTSSDLTTPSTTITRLETRSAEVGFFKKHQKNNLPIFIETTPEISALSTVEHTDGIKEVYASPPTLNDAIFHSPSLSLNASSSPTQYTIEHKKLRYHAQFSNRSHLQCP
jgi:hypothetical protein